MSEFFVAVVRNKGPTDDDDCILSVFPSNSISPMAVMNVPSRRTSSVVCKPFCLTPEKNPKIWSKNDNELGS